MSADRCEPPEGTADGSWHWLQEDGGETRLALRECPGKWFVPAFECIMDEEEMVQEFGYRYVGPVTTPEEVAALRAKIAELQGATS